MSCFWFIAFCPGEIWDTQKSFLRERFEPVSFRPYIPAHVEEESRAGFDSPARRASK
jgi:hypothetical protein